MSGSRKTSKKVGARRGGASRARQASPRRRRDLSEFDDDALLDLRFKDLGLTLDGPLEDCLLELYDELEERGLRFRPHAWLSTEWMSPVGVPGIAIPFFLAHPRLRRLERKMMLDVEGGTRTECLKLLRHECGHAIQQAYRLHRRRRWQQLFGHSSKSYPAFYRPDPSSKRFVQHLRLFYAQSHPDEDFAETFAVWLGPRGRWRKRYAGWPALAKLEYVDELMAEVGDQTPPVRSRAQVEPLSSIDRTLRKHYARRLDRSTSQTPDIYDRHLRQLFSDDPRHADALRASTFLRRNRGGIRRLVSRWTGEYQLTLDQVLEEMIDRCRELDLRVVGDEVQVRTDFAVVLTVATMHFLYSKPVWIAV